MGYAAGLLWPWILLLGIKATRRQRLLIRLNESESTTTGAAEVARAATLRSLIRRIRPTATQPAEYDRQLAGLLSELARAVRSGANLPIALAESVATGSGTASNDLRDVLRNVERGGSWQESLAGWARAQPNTAAPMIAGGLAVGLQMGTASGRVMDGLVGTLRVGLDGQDEARALSSQARYSALVLSLAPIGFMFLNASVGGDTWAFLLRSPLGVLCLGVGLALDAASAWWMARIVNSVR